MKEHDINKKIDFLQGWYLDDKSICDKLIEYHKNSNRKNPGWIGNGVYHTVNKNIKDSTDVVLENSLWEEYISILNTVCQEYIKKYYYCNFYSPWGVHEPVIIQYYKPKGGYFAWHTERVGISGLQISRHLVFMTYLNNVTDGGETEFFHQKVKIKPEKGLTLIWPADWTFTHRGITSNTQEKYIVTGWLNYEDQPK